jgi:hypothetical protein
MQSAAKAEPEARKREETRKEREEREKEEVDSPLIDASPADELSESAAVEWLWNGCEW